MDKPNDLESKYQRLATEFSKVRSQVVVLKKAVLDEQAKNLELREMQKKYEQKIRKHDQEMESLTFRNEQLTKRIGVLQQELQKNSHSKKTRNKSQENLVQCDMTVLDEELQKKILENAQLMSSMADKEMELTDCKDQNLWLERKLEDLQKTLQDTELKYLKQVDQLKREKFQIEKKMGELRNSDNSFLLQPASSVSSLESNSDEVRHWKEEAERWRSECELNHSKPKSNEELTDYYESRFKTILEAKQLAVSETKTLWAENAALNSRLENLVLENRELQNDLERSNEELQVTIENYKSQLDAMTEHLAAQNDKITKQCDEIQVLRHKASLRK